MILRYLGHDKSQSYLASQMGAAITNYGDNVMAPTINYDLTGNISGWYIQTNVSDLATYQKEMEADIINNYPLAIAAYENAYYNLDPGEILWKHWFDVNGYAYSGTTSYYADPAGNANLWLPWNPAPTGGIASSTIYGMMSYGGYGYVW
jgi:hypothetical protein